MNNSGKEISESLLTAEDLAELIANGYDADAETVTVRLPLNLQLASQAGGKLKDLGYTIEVEDDGHGMTPDEAKAVVRYARHPLDIEEVQAHIAAGKLPTKLALTWESRISFLLTDKLEIKRIRALDILKFKLDVLWAMNDAMATRYGVNA